ncbi:hypothetical protein K1719_031381 [Acacia pycnantha]|nr:hypothetical protein K1719_031381 [Acacia pycnantha]
MGESFRGPGSLKNKSVGRAEQEGTKDKDGRGKSGILANKNVNVEKLRHDNQTKTTPVEGVAAIYREKHGGKVVNMAGKENLNLGDPLAKASRKEDMDAGGLPDRGSVGNPSDGLVWNSRGAASKGFAIVLRDMKRRYRLDLVVILEPRISGNLALKVIKSWGFKHSIRMEAVGFSGGIWLMWELDDLVVDAKIMDEQFIHFKLKLGGEELLFTTVYAQPNEQRRKRIWELLQGLAGEIVEPWMLVGDFNEIRTPMEQRGGGRINEVRCNKFNQWIEDCNLIDVEASSPFFTWNGPKWMVIATSASAPIVTNGLERVYKRLDRCLGNIYWQEKFEEAEVRVIPRVCSDHHPLVVLKRENKGLCKRNFRFEAMWKMHSNFETVLRNSWMGREEIHIKLANLQQELIS